MSVTFAPFAATLVNFWTCERIVDQHQKEHPSHVPCTHESAATTADENDELREVRGIIRKGIARIVNDSRVVARGKHRERLSDREGQSREVSDGVVLNTLYGRVLERNDSVVETCDRDDIDTIARAGRVPGADSALVAC